MYRYIKMANKYHQKIKEKLCKEVRERYQNLFQEEKEKTQKKTQDRYENLSEDEKEKKHQYYRDQNKNLSEEKKTKESWVYEKLLFRWNKNFSGFYKVVWKLRIAKATFRITNKK